jgi:hypothetical protein
MRMIAASATGLALCLAASAAFAQAQPQEISQPTTQPASTSTASASSGDAGNQVICRSEVVHGSLIPTRTCHTQREWESMRLQSQRTTNDSQMRGLTSRPMGK